YAAFIVEEIPNGSLSLDEYLSEVLKNKKEKRPTMKEVTRASLQFGRKNGRRLLTSWENKGTKFRGFNTVCSDGENYYMLYGWCDDRVFNQAYESFRQLEEGFKLTIQPPKEKAKPATPMLGSSDAG